MFDWFRHKEEVVTQFNDNDSAFAHARTIGYPLLLGALIPALVMEEGRCGADGERWYYLDLASQDGPLKIWGATLPHAPAYPEIGDLVAFRIVRFATELPDHASLIGFIDCRLEPVLNGIKGWRIAASFRTDNIKPAIHLG